MSSVFTNDQLTKRRVRWRSNKSRSAARNAVEAYGVWEALRIASHHNGGGPQPVETTLALAVENRVQSGATGE